MNQETLVETIKKLLALAASPNENEAQLAMKRAQDLIARFSVSIAEDVQEKIIEVIYECPSKSPGLHRQLPQICSTLAPIFGCHSLWFPRMNQIRLIGFATNTKVATFAIDSVIAQVMIDFKTEYKKYRSVAFSDGFFVGVVKALQKRFSEQIKVGTGLVLYDKAKAYIDATFQFIRGDSITHGTFGLQSGFKSGSEAQIRSGLTSQSTGKLLK